MYFGTADDEKKAPVPDWDIGRTTEMLEAELVEMLTNAFPSDDYLEEFKIEARTQLAAELEQITAAEKPQ